MLAGTGLVLVPAALGGVWLALKPSTLLSAPIPIGTQTEAAIDVWQEMLRLNPNDNQGVRYALFFALLPQRRHDALAALVERYEDDLDITWRYGRAVAFGQPTGTWAARALGFAVVVGLALWGAYVVACVVVLLGEPGGSANLAAFIGFAAFESSVYVLLGTVFVTIPIGCLWVTLLRL
ncbi:MAG: hypothetical protein B7X11_05545, partial [Acidobacteria bacterium 37-65-4]